MVYNTQDYWVFGLCPSSGILKNTTFQKLHLFLSSGERWEDTYSIWLEWTQQSRCLPTPHLRTETDAVSETLCSFRSFRVPDDGQGPKTQ
jgi:hypothetical protein